MGFSRQEYWNGLPFPSPRDLPDPGIKPVSPELARGFFCVCVFFLPLVPPGKPLSGGTQIKPKASFQTAILFFK